EMQAIIPHQTCKPQQARLRGMNEGKRQLRLPCPGGAPNEHSTGTGKHGRTMHRRDLASRHHMAGKRTVNRAPMTCGGSSVAEVNNSRFSPQIRPSCASTICLEIERPSPEFCPNA